MNALLNHRISADLGRPMAVTDWDLLHRMVDVLGERVQFGELPAEPPPPDLKHLLSEDRSFRPERIMIHAGASRSYKQWSIERYRAVADLLSQDGFEVLWCAQGGEPATPLSPGVQVVPELTLREFVRVVGGCGLFLGNNSGPMNIANALQVPSVIFSGPSPRKWDPFWHRDRVVNLRLPELSCQPCDKNSGPVNQCQNQAEPMACMNRWSELEVRRAVVSLWTRCYERAAPARSRG